MTARAEVHARDRRPGVEKGPSKTELADLAARRLEAVREGIKKAGGDGGRLKVAALSTAESAEGQVKVDLVEPEDPGPPGRPGFLRRLLGQTGPDGRPAAELRWTGAAVARPDRSGSSPSAACATVDPWQDARIESEVKARLVAEKDANLTRLGVVSRQSVVYLTGDVVSAEQKARAESVARTVGGVRRVVNALEVRAPVPAPRPDHRSAGRR